MNKKHIGAALRMSYAATSIAQVSGHRWWKGGCSKRRARPLAATAFRLPNVASLECILTHLASAWILSDARQKVLG